ncbi:hypothetical protein GCM10025768_03910 [Microbacterium pseudoresistens]|uniref:NRDE family protein n=1 Tax=Microbacterium pseudoresistens TaxID=640634 RepID=A0A7Y9EUJ6_9MICO|nr:hypothetical protein [Microbacterium pseudoresistens]
MCTVVIDVAEPGGSRLLAVRDEDPQRAWDALGAWWPEEYPGVVGIRDRRAGGAWLAADPSRHRLAVLLNRADELDLPEDQVQSRGSLALESVVGRSPVAPLRMHGFNLLEVGPDAARVLSWNGTVLRETPVTPGVHMIAHDDLDDPATARIARWLPEFRAAPARNEEWARAWVDLLAATAALDPEDDAAIIRDNRPHGYPTQSLLFCVAAVGHDGVTVRDHTLAAPGHWG